MTTIHWFRQDLRLSDNPALLHAAARGAVIPVFVLDETAAPNGRPPGAASRWWLHQSLERLSAALGGLAVMRGDPAEVLTDLVRKTKATAITWNRCYEPTAISRDRRLKAEFVALGLDVQSFNASLLHEPWEVETLGGGPFKVYSPFWKACLKRPVAPPQVQPRFKLAKLDGLGISINAMALRPQNPNWAAGWEKLWAPGEMGAHARLAAFVADGLAGYGELRNRPDRRHVSRLSPHIHWGEISPRTIWRAVTHAADAGDVPRADSAKFLAEIGWREFAHHLLYHFPALPERNWKPAFDGYPWRENAADLRAWQRGMTGYPLVDAGMRELWATGYMHNRVRMVVASFLVKHLRIDWRRGEAWFWDTLLDADLANNAASWQWVAGSGADAAPYFRIFNPMEQSRRFDPDGAYIRRWCPELAQLAAPDIHAPFEAPEGVLRSAGVMLGKTYPHPIVEHQAARAAALAGYALVKAAAAP